MARHDLDFLLDHASVRDYVDGAHVTDPADGPAQRFVIILDGRVHGLTSSSEPGHAADGGEAWELRAGECFPIGALLGHRPVHTTQAAQGQVRTLELPVEDFQQLLRQSPAFADFCTRRLANLLDRVQQRLQADMGGSANIGALQTPVGQLINAPSQQQILAEQTHIRALLAHFADHDIDAVAIGTPERVVGLLTLRDVAQRIALAQVDLDRPVSEVMTPDPVRIAADRPAYEAGQLLASHGFHHLVVTDADGRLVGLLSETDLYKRPGPSPGQLIHRIDRAGSTAELADLARQTPDLVAMMVEQGASFSQIGRMVSLINDQLTRRVIDRRLAEQPIPESIDWAWLVFGSEARQEQTLSTDQDNGIVFRTDGDTEAARQRLLTLADGINRDLAEIGFPLCPGNIMARNPECCLTLDEWRTRFRRWIDQGTPEHLLNASIFFDHRHVHGNRALLAELQGSLAEATVANSRFRQQMAANALRSRPPLGLLGQFKTQRRPDNKATAAIDLKHSGATPFVDVARIEALESGSTASNTVERIEGMQASAADRQSWAAAYEFIQMLRLRQQLARIAANEPPDNWIEPEKLDELSQRILKEAFRQARKLQQRLAVHYQL